MITVIIRKLSGRIFVKALFAGLGLNDAEDSLKQIVYSQTVFLTVFRGVAFWEWSSEMETHWSFTTIRKGSCDFLHLGGEARQYKLVKTPAESQISIFSAPQGLLEKRAWTGTKVCRDKRLASKFMADWIVLEFPFLSVKFSPSTAYPPNHCFSLPCLQ